MPDIKYDVNGLVPVVVQHERTNKVLMLAYADERAVLKTMETGTAWFWSRSRKSLWNKGETSGNYIHVSSIEGDCDMDALIYRGVPRGPVCHTGAEGCFFNSVWEERENV